MRTCTALIASTTTLKGYKTHDDCHWMEDKEKERKSVRNTKNEYCRMAL